MKAGTFSKGIQRLPYLKVFLEVKDVIFLSSFHENEKVDFVVGWGHKKNTAKAQQFAFDNSIPFIRLEDGFVRSLGVAQSATSSISLMVDKQGIYYDSRTPSYVEEILNSDHIFDSQSLDEAAQAIQFISENEISKYNGGPSYLPAKEHSCTDILVIDQVSGDASLEHGMVDEFKIENLIHKALEDNPDSTIYVKTHPASKSHQNKNLVEHYPKNQVILLSGNVNPISLLKHFSKVYVATSQLGFEALLLGKDVTCFGMPFYAGWGLTKDLQSCSRRTRKRSIEEVFATAYVLSSRYVNPVTGSRCNLTDALEFINFQVTASNKLKGDVFCYGIRHWKRYNILPFLSNRYNRVNFVKTIDEARKAGVKQGDHVVVWGAREPKDIDKLLSITGTELVRMEDGFLRSVGLGSDFAKPSSLVLDSSGIYFDPAKPSDLEKILAKSEFTAPLLDQAVSIRNKILKNRLTKYNTESECSLNIAPLKVQTVILVPGQVEDDASIQLGCPGVKTNFGLLKAVREENPDAFIIYKPHPDVVSGNRKGTVSALESGAVADYVATSVSIHTCLDVVDEVHTMTSLVGFESLLRNKKVTIYGQPFYSGWGLTRDIHPIHRRTRKLSLNELVAGTLLLYPRYYHWDSGFFTTCEEIINDLHESKKMAELNTGIRRLNPTYLERQVKKLGMIIKGMRYAG